MPAPYLGHIIEKHFGKMPETEIKHVKVYFTYHDSFDKAPVQIKEEFKSLHFKAGEESSFDNFLTFLKKYQPYTQHDFIPTERMEYKLGNIGKGIAKITISLPVRKKYEDEQGREVHNLKPTLIYWEIQKQHDLAIIPV